MFAIVLAAVAGATPGSVIPGPAAGPVHLTATWVSNGCDLTVTVRNDSRSPVEIDWNRSVIATPDAGSVRLVPGSASKLTSMSGMQPMVVGGGSHGSERLFRVDRLPADAGNVCTLDAPSQVVVTLKVDDEWLTQPLDVAVDAEAQRAEIRAAIALLDAPRQTVLSKPKLDLHVGELCFKTPTAWGAECHSTVGAEFETTKATLAAVMAPCPEVLRRTAIRSLEDWKSARIAGDWTVWWTYGIGGIAYGLAGEHATKVEAAYSACVKAFGGGG